MLKVPKKLLKIYRTNIAGKGNYSKNWSILKSIIMIYNTKENTHTHTQAPGKNDYQPLLELHYKSVSEEKKAYVKVLLWPAQTLIITTYSLSYDESRRLERHVYMHRHTHSKACMRPVTLTSGFWAWLRWAWADWGLHLSPNGSAWTGRSAQTSARSEAGNQQLLLLLLLFIEGLLIAPWTAQGFSLVQILRKLDYLENQHKTCTPYKYKTCKHNLKVSPFGIALVKKWQIKLGDAGTIDRFDLAFQYQITKKSTKLTSIYITITYTSYRHFLIWSDKNYWENTTCSFTFPMPIWAWSRSRFI